MALVLSGKEVIASMKERMTAEVEKLHRRGVEPAISIIRVGARPDDLAYERGACKRMDSVGVKATVLELPADIEQRQFEEEFRSINDDPDIHGILLLRPLPAQLSYEPLAEMINPYKDVDCMGPRNLAKVFMCDPEGHAPCTAEAVIELLHYYGYDPDGMDVCVVGRSMVVGKPLSIMLQKRNATVTMCHTHTRNLAEECLSADLICVAAGHPGIITADMVKDHSIVVDVGINIDEEGNMCGDVCYDEVSAKAAAVTPVPGGVGGVTTSVLVSHVIHAAQMLSQ